MKRRSTFVHDSKVDVDPSQLRLAGDHFRIRELKAAREERLTVGFNELPKELWQVLKQTHELHIRWTAERPYSVTPPWISKISPGLHAFFTPLKGQTGESLCPLLQKVFSEQLKCSSPLETFTSPPLISSRFSSTSSLQYHSLLPSLSNLVAYLQQKICHADISCMHSTALLNIADFLDIDYDAISHALTFTANWSKPPPVFFDHIASETFYDSWTITVDAHADKVEVGVLSNEAATDPAELQLSGFLTVVGEDTTPAPTLFSFPSRHHILPAAQSSAQAYSVSFQQPTGLHPTMQISFPSRQALSPPMTNPSESTCALHTYLTLPSALFADKYQLSSTDPLFLQSHHLRALHSISSETDLEAPDYVIQKWGSNVLLELDTPDPDASFPIPITNAKTPYIVTIPLHLRYLPPTAGGLSQIQIPWPVVFWACTSDDGTKFPVNPFDRVNLGYDGLFGPRTMFYHLDVAGGNKSLVETLDVPVLDTEAVGARWIESGTVLVVLLGFAWVVWKLWPGLRTEARELGLGRKGEEKEENDEKKKK